MSFITDNHAVFCAEMSACLPESFGSGSIVYRQKTRSFQNPSIEILNLGAAIQVPVAMLAAAQNGQKTKFLASSLPLIKKVEIGYQDDKK